MRAFAAVAIGCLIAGGSAVGAQTPDASREERIAVHRQRIEDILRANQVVVSADQQTSGPTFPVRILSPEMFEKRIVPLLEKSGAAASQVTTLRELNGRLWDRRTLDKVNGPDLETTLRIRAEQQKVLTPEQAETFRTLYYGQTASRRITSGTLSGSKIQD